MALLQYSIFENIVLVQIYGIEEDLGTALNWKCRMPWFPYLPKM